MDQVSNALAVIGVYFALMAVLSVKVEAVMSWLKVPIHGLHGKPSPEDVLIEIADRLPADQREATLARITALNKALVAIGKVGLQLQDDATVDQLVERIGRATTEYIRQDRGICFAFCTHVPGLLRSGVAASAGSSSWHDQSARLRQLKNAAEAVGELTAGR